MSQEASQEVMKQKAALRALEAVKDGMKLGLGTGSTVKYFVEGLGEKVAAGLKVQCVSTSEVTRKQAESLNIPLIDLSDVQRLDLTVDGADELDDGLALIKGGGGALLREKIVAAASDAMIIIADDTKAVDRLGAFPLPVEVNMFAHETTARAICHVLEETGHHGDVVLRASKEDANKISQPFVTDCQHYIYDCQLGAINDIATLSEALLSIPGVVEHGLFIGLATGAIIACEDGLIEKGFVE